LKERQARLGTDGKEAKLQMLGKTASLRLWRPVLAVSLTFNVFPWYDGKLTKIFNCQNVLG